MHALRATRLVPLLLLVCVCNLTQAGCRSTYYAFWETFGKEKRHLLKDQVESAHEEQKEATAEFKDALTRLQELYGASGGDLEKTYRRLNDDYEQCVSRADVVRTRITKVEQVAEDLFGEWNKELASYTNPKLKADSEAKLAETRSKYAALHAAMKKAEGSTAPVLSLFKDHVLYLKHNLNAQAIGSLRGEMRNIEKEIGRLIQDMNKSISEADAFIKTL